MLFASARPLLRSHQPVRSSRPDVCFTDTEAALLCRPDPFPTLTRALTAPPVQTRSRLEPFQPACQPLGRLPVRLGNFTFRVCQRAAFSVPRLRTPLLSRKPFASFSGVEAGASDISAVGGSHAERTTRSKLPDSTPDAADAQEPRSRPRPYDGTFIPRLRGSREPAPKPRRPSPLPGRWPSSWCNGQSLASRKVAPVAESRLEGGGALGRVSFRPFELVRIAPPP